MTLFSHHYNYYCFTNKYYFKFIYEGKLHAKKFKEGYSVMKILLDQFNSIRLEPPENVADIKKTRY